MDFGFVNAFLSCQDLSESEQVLKQNLVGLDSLLKRLREETSSAGENLRRKEQELLKVQGALENQLAVVEQLAKARGLEPLVPPSADSDQETEVAQVAEQPAV